MSETVQYYGRLYSTTRGSEQILEGIKEMGSVQVWESPASMFVRYGVAAAALGGLSAIVGNFAPELMGEAGNFVTVPLLLLAGLVFLYGMRIAMSSPAMMIISTDGLHVPVRGLFVPWRAVRGWSGQSANLGFCTIPIVNVSVVSRQVQRYGRFTWLYSFYGGAWILPFILAPFVRGTPPDRPLNTHIVRVFGGEGADCLEKIFNEEVIDKLQVEASERH